MPSEALESIREIEISFFRAPTGNQKQVVHTAGKLASIPGCSVRNRSQFSRLIIGPSERPMTG